MPDPPPKAAPKGNKARGWPLGPPPIIDRCVGAVAVSVWCTSGVGVVTVSVRWWCRCGDGCGGGIGAVAVFSCGGGVGADVWMATLNNTDAMTIPMQ